MSVVAVHKQGDRVEAGGRCVDGKLRAWFKVIKTLTEWERDVNFILSP